MFNWLDSKQLEQEAIRSANEYASPGIYKSTNTWFMLGRTKNM